MLQADSTLLVVIDIQDALARAMHDAKQLIAGAVKLARGMKVLDVPAIFTEQNPAGLGPTVPPLAEVLEEQPITKRAFSCCGAPAFVQAVEAAGRKQIVLCGIESHVCVYQTAVDLLARGCEVQVAGDAVSSRTEANKQVGLDKMRAAGAGVTSVETALFELLKVAEGPKFKEILAIVK